MSGVDKPKVTFKLKVKNEHEFEQTQRAILSHDMTDLGYNNCIKKVCEGTYLVEAGQECREILSNYGNVD